MEEFFKPKIEKEPEKSATNIHMENLNPELWQKLFCLSSEQQDERWLNLTQKHLKDYEQGKSATEEFELEELEFLFLNQLTSKNISFLDPEMPQKGFYFNPEQPAKQRMEKFGNFGNFTRIVQKEAEKHLKETSKPFQILVGGIGISGKATLRNVLTKELSENLPKQKIISWDRDYQKIFPIPDKWQGNINIIEDVHGLDEEWDENKKLKRFDGIEGLPEGYDMVVYVLPSKATFRQSLIKRGIGWLRSEKMDLTAPGKQYPEGQRERIKQTAEELERYLPEAKKWFREQLRVLKELKNKGVKIVVVDPMEIFKKLYGFKEKPGLLDKSFSDALKETFLKKED